MITSDNSSLHAIESLLALGCGVNTPGTNGLPVICSKKYMCAQCKAKFDSFSKTDLLEIICTITTQKRRSRFIKKSVKQSRVIL